MFEGWAPFELIFERVGPATLFVNMNVAFLLNVAVVFLIGCASSLVLTLSGASRSHLRAPPILLAAKSQATDPFRNSGVVKDILLVSGSVILFGSTVTGTQMLGYSIALAGAFPLPSVPFRVVLLADTPPVVGLVFFKTKPEDLAVYLAQAKALVGR